MVQALSSTERGYDLLAPKFDHTPFRTPDAILEAVAAHLAAGAPFGSGLDLCCGTGAGMRMLHPLCRDRVVGLDVSRGMLETGRRSLADLSGGAPLGWVRGNALDLPLGAAFDVAVCLGACGHFVRRDEALFLRQVRGVLRPGGRFVMVTSHGPSVRSRRFWLAQGFNAAMRVRNVLVSPPFVMYYLTFLLPQVRHELERQGFAVDVRPIARSGPLSHLRLVCATLPAL
jgi:ubiquinone/menaquinone biosynthesis C-methylase UbiE